MTNQTRKSGWYWVVQYSANKSSEEWEIMYFNSLGFTYGDGEYYKDDELNEIDETPIERKPKQDYPTSATSAMIQLHTMIGYSWREL